MESSAGLAGSTFTVAEKSIKARIIEDVVAKIRAGELPPEAKLPSIAELCAEYRASTTPVKAALDWLDAKGYIRRYQGRGTFVAPTLPADDPPVGS